MRPGGTHTLAGAAMREWTVLEGLTILAARAVDVVRQRWEKAIQCHLRGKYKMKERLYEKE